MKLLKLMNLGPTKLLKRSLIGIILTSVFSTGAMSVSLPDESVITEISGQLTELAIADINPIFAKQLKGLIVSSNLGPEEYAQSVMDSYFLIKNFHIFYENSPWANRQKLSFKNYKSPLIKSEDKLSYESDVLSGEIKNQIFNLRPQVANYDLYRNHIANILSKEINLPHYEFVFLKPGARGAEVGILQKALRAKGYVSDEIEESNIFNEDLVNAVKSFQTDNRLKADGIVGRMTYDQLYKSNQDKAVNLARNIFRLSNPELHTTDTFILVNIPQAQAFVYSDHKELFTTRVIAGSPRRPSPLLVSNIDNIVFNPSWYVPASIKKHEYLPNLAKDPYYLEKRGLHMLDHNNKKITPEEYAANAEAGTNNQQFRIVQKPGARNALGLYKFNFPNNYSVYLHSTPNMSKFNLSYRYLSHGCIRVEKSRELAEFLLQDTEYDTEEIGKIIKNGKTKWVKVENKPQVILSYVTGYIDAEGKDIFFSDPYNYDKHSKLDLDLIKTFLYVKSEND